MGALAAVLQRIQPGSNSRRTGLIGLECALNAIHLVQLAVDSDGAIRVHAMASEPFTQPREQLLADTGEFSKVLKRALGRDRFRGNAIVTTLPSSEMKIIPVSYRVSENRQDDAAIIECMSERLNGALSRYVIDYLPVRSEQGAEERMAIVAYAPREAVIRHLELLRKSGLDTRHLEIGPSAIRRLVSSLGRRDEHANVLAINFGRASSFLTVISGARLLFDQEIRFGENQLLGVIEKALQMAPDGVQQLVQTYGLDSDAAANAPAMDGLSIDTGATLQEIVQPEFLRLAEEINRTLIYAASQTRGEPVSRIYLLGSLARWRGADRLLNRLVKLDVQTIPDPLQVFRDADGKNSSGISAMPEIAVATGLAMHGMLDDD